VQKNIGPPYYARNTTIFTIKFTQWLTFISRFLAAQEERPETTRHFPFCLDAATTDTFFNCYNRRVFYFCLYVSFLNCNDSNYALRMTTYKVETFAINFYYCLNVNLYEFNYKFWIDIDICLGLLASLLKFIVILYYWALNLL